MATAGCEVHQQRPPGDAPGDIAEQSPSEESPGDSAVLQRLSKLAKTAPALYSFAFSGISKESREARYFIELELGEPDALCRARGLESSGDLGERWTLGVELPDTARGTYAVYASPGRSGQARVRLYHRDAGEYLGAYNAISGVVELFDTPSFALAREGARLRGKVTASFGLPLAMSLGCRGAAREGGADFVGECDCRTTEGSVYSCPIEASTKPAEVCCYETFERSYDIQFAFDAEHCLPACRAMAGSPNFCLQSE